MIKNIYTRVPKNLEYQLGFIEPEAEKYLALVKRNCDLYDIRVEMLEIKEVGIKCFRDIPKDAVLAIYTGAVQLANGRNVLDRHSLEFEITDRDADYHLIIKGNTGKRGLDKRYRGQYYNHQCKNFNCYVEHHEILTDKREETMGLFLLRAKDDIKAPAELNYNYGGTALRTEAQAKALIAELAAKNVEAIYEKCICDDGKCTSGKGFVKIIKKKKPRKARDASDWEEKSNGSVSDHPADPESIQPYNEAPLFGPDDEEEEDVVSDTEGINNSMGTLTLSPPAGEEAWDVTPILSRAQLAEMEAQDQLDRHPWGWFLNWYIKKHDIAESHTQSAFEEGYYKFNAGHFEVGLSPEDNLVQMWTHAPHIQPTRYLIYDAHRAVEEVRRLTSDVNRYVKEWTRLEEGFL